MCVRFRLPVSVVLAFHCLLRRRPLRGEARNGRRLGLENVRRFPFRRFLEALVTVFVPTGGLPKTYVKKQFSGCVLKSLSTRNRKIAIPRERLRR